MNFLEFSQDIAEIIDNINNSNSLENKSEDFLSPENLFPSYKKSIIDSQAKINKIHNFDNDLKANQTKNSRNFLENSKGIPQYNNL